MSKSTLTDINKLVRSLTANIEKDEKEKDIELENSIQEYFSVIKKLPKENLEKIPYVLHPDAKLILPDTKSLPQENRYQILSIYSYRIRVLLNFIKHVQNANPHQSQIRNLDIDRYYFFTNYEMDTCISEVSRLREGGFLKLISKQFFKEFLNYLKTIQKKIDTLILKNTPKQLKDLTIIERDFYCLASIGSGLIQEDVWVPGLNERNLETIAEISKELMKLYRANEINEINTPKSRLFKDGIISVPQGDLLSNEWENVDVMIEGLGVRKFRLRGQVSSQSPEYYQPATTLDDVVLPERIKTDLKALCSEYKRRISSGRKAKLSIYFEGPPGTGKTITAEAIAKELGVKVLKLVVSQARVSFLSNILSYYSPRAALNQSLILFDEADDMLSGNSFTGVSEAWAKTAFEEFDGVAIFTSNRPVSEAIKRRMTYCVNFKKPNATARAIMYEQEIKKACEEAEIKVRPTSDEIEALAEEFSLPAGYVAQALMLSIARSTPGTLDFKEVKEAFKQRQIQFREENGREITPKIYLSDVKLNLKARNEIHSFLRFAKETIENKSDNNSFCVPPGATILFSGPPGTGKTITAEAIAKELNRPFMRISPSNILSMWVGGSEKNIRAIFEEAQDNGSVLMIDEAEGLFSDRSGAKNSWEVTQANELLQQVEKFKGVLIIATNHSDRIDPAFARRFIFKVIFDRPDEVTRKDLWNQWKEKLNLSDESIDHLSRAFELTGGEIRNVCIRVLARNEMNLDQIMDACRMELVNRTGREARRLGV